MNFIRTRAAIMLALALSISQALPAFAMHAVLDSSSYVLTETAEGVTCTGTDGKPVTGWISDKDSNLYYFNKGEMNHGWDKIKGEWYYFDPDTGILATNTKAVSYTHLDVYKRQLVVRTYGARTRLEGIELALRIGGSRGQARYGRRLAL